MTVNEKDNSKYCYNVVLSAIQYSKDDTKWSPNNIRRLIISADGVAVQLHTSRKPITVPFSRDSAYKCFLDENYKPMVSALTSRVCSSVEEIIFCTASKNGLSMNSRELDLRSIVDLNRKSVSSDEVLKNAIMARFKRLRGLVITNQTISQFLSKEGEHISSHTYQCCDSDYVKSVSNIIELHKDDWHKGYYLREKDYYLDRTNGVLYNTLHKVETDIEASKKNSSIEDSKKKHIGDLAQKITSAESSTMKVLLPFKNLSILFSKTPLVCLFNDDNKFLSILLYKTCSNYSFNNTDSLLSSEFIKVAEQVGIEITSEKCESKDNASKIASDLQRLQVELYLYFCDYFLSKITEFGETYPITTKVKLSVFDRVVYIPSSLESKVVKVNEYLSSALSGTSVADSVANICAVLCFLMLSDSGNSGIKKYYKKGSWIYAEGGKK